MDDDLPQMILVIQSDRMIFLIACGVISYEWIGLSKGYVVLPSASGEKRRGKKKINAVPVDWTS